MLLFKQFTGATNFMKNPNDLRTKFSKKVIKDSLVELLKTKELNEITVKQICELAEINRGTFYNHFENIEQAYDAVQHDFYQNIVSRLETKEIISVDGAFFIELMHFVINNKIIVRTIIKEFSTSKLLKDLISYTLERFIKEFSQLYPQIPTEKVTDISLYIIHGTLGIMINMINEDRIDEINYVSNLIINLNYIITHAFLSQFEKL